MSKMTGDLDMICSFRSSKSQKPKYLLASAQHKHIRKQNGKAFTISTNDASNQPTSVVT
jgi:hypothetical protein